MGLPGSGKTWLGERLGKHFNIPYWDADDVRRIYNDWEFTQKGRERQALRMRRLSEVDHLSISGFVCPLPGYRSFFFPDKLIWMDTIKEGKYEDTNKLFIDPTGYDLRIRKWIDENQLYNSLEDFNHGMKDTQNFLNELIQKLDKCAS